jgi:hypothetical protein
MTMTLRDRIRREMLEALEAGPSLLLTYGEHSILSALADGAIVIAGRASGRRLYADTARDSARIEQQVSFGSLHTGHPDHDATPEGMLGCEHDAALTANQVIAWRAAHTIQVRPYEMDLEGFTQLGQTGFYDAVQGDHRRYARDLADALRTNRAVDLILSCGTPGEQDLDRLRQVLAWIETGRSLLCDEEYDAARALHVEQCVECLGDGMVTCPECDGDGCYECGSTTEVRCTACGGYSDPWTDADRAAMERVDARHRISLGGEDAVHAEFVLTVGPVNLTCPGCRDAVMAHDSRHCTAGSAEENDRCACPLSRVEAYLSALRAAASDSVFDYLNAGKPAPMEPISVALYAYAQARIGGDPYRADILAAFAEVTDRLGALDDRTRSAISGWLRAMYHERPAELVHA